MHDKICHSQIDSELEEERDTGRVCELCENALFNKRSQLMQGPVKLFQQCGHAFHQHCLSSNAKENAAAG